MGLAARLRGFSFTPRAGGGGRFDGDPSEARDIDDELAFHLENRTRELVASGMTPDEARAEALRRFGDLQRVRAECRRIRTGGWLMWQRITLVVLAVMVVVLSWFSYQSLVQQSASRQEITALRAEIHSLIERTKAVESTTPAAGPSQPQLDARSSFVDMRTQQLRLLSGLGYVGDHARGGQSGNRALHYSSEETTGEAWLAGFREDAALTDPAQRAAALEDRAIRLARDCSPERGLTLLNQLWNELTPAACDALLEAFVNGVNETTARRAVFLSTMDDDPEVSKRGFDRLRELCLVRFDAASRDAYLEWSKANEDLDLSEIGAREAPRLIQELSGFSEWNAVCELYSPLVMHPSIPAANALPQQLCAAGALQLVKRWSASNDPRARLAAIRWLGVLEADEVTARMLLMPLLQDPRPRDPEFFPAICDALTKIDHSWTWEVLLGELTRILRAPELDRASLDRIASVIGQRDPEHLLPTVIAWIVKLDSPAVTESLGRAAMPGLANVDYDPIQDGTWWLNWWSINRGNYDHDGAGPQGLPKID